MNAANQPEPSLRDDGKCFIFNVDINASDEFKAGFNEATEQVGRAISLGNILIQAHKEAAVREAQLTILDTLMESLHWTAYGDDLVLYHAVLEEVRRGIAHPQPTKSKDICTCDCHTQQGAAQDDHCSLC